MAAPLPPGIGGAAAGNSPAAAGSAPVVLADATVRALPNRLVGLDRPVTLSGQVVAQDGGNATIRTAAGDVSVDTPVPLPTDKPIILRLPAQTPGVLPPVQLLGTPAPAPQVSTARPDATTTQASSTPATVTPPPSAQAAPALQSGAVISALVLATGLSRPVSTSGIQQPATTPDAAEPSAADDGAADEAAAPAPVPPRAPTATTPMQRGGGTSLTDFLFTPPSRPGLPSAPAPMPATPPGAGVSGGQSPIVTTPTPTMPQPTAAPPSFPSPPAGTPASSDQPPATPSPPSTGARPALPMTIGNTPQPASPTSRPPLAAPPPATSAGSGPDEASPLPPKLVGAPPPPAAASAEASPQVSVPLPIVGARPPLPTAPAPGATPTPTSGPAPNAMGTAAGTAPPPPSSPPTPISASGLGEPDPARQSRAARFNLVSLPATGLLSLQDFDARPASTPTRPRDGHPFAPQKAAAPAPDPTATARVSVPTAPPAQIPPGIHPEVPAIPADNRPASTGPQPNSSPQQPPSAPPAGPAPQARAPVPGVPDQGSPMTAAAPGAASRPTNTVGNAPPAAAPPAAPAFPAAGMRLVTFPDDKAQAFDFSFGPASTRPPPGPTTGAGAVPVPTPSVPSAAVGVTPWTEPPPRTAPSPVSIAAAPARTTADRLAPPPSLPTVDAAPPPRTDVAATRNAAPPLTQGTTPPASPIMAGQQPPAAVPNIAAAPDQGPVSPSTPAATAAPATVASPPDRMVMPDGAVLPRFTAPPAGTQSPGPALTAPPQSPPTAPSQTPQPPATATPATLAQPAPSPAIPVAGPGIGAAAAAAAGVTAPASGPAVPSGNAATAPSRPPQGEASPPAASAPPADNQVPAPRPLAAGQSVMVRVLGIGDPAASTGEMTVNGTLAGTTSQGQPIVTSPVGTLVLKAVTDLPVGTAVALAIEPDMAANPRRLLPPLDPLQGQDWPALRTAMETLIRNDPETARALAGAFLPQPNKRLTTNLVFFLSALRGGDAAGWLGDETTEAIRHQGGDRLLAQLKDDFQAAARQMTEPSADGWRSIPFPFGTPDQLSRAQLHLRTPSREEQEAAATKGERGAAKRFVVDLNFTRLGPMQLDGLVWTGRLDLMIRTQSLLPADMRRHIGEIFRDSLSTMGFAGNIDFQTGAHMWVRLRSGAGGAPIRA